MDDAFAELVDVGVDVRRACGLVGRPRSTHYWRARPRPVVATQRVPRPAPANALSVPERDRVLALLRDPAFVDKSPAQVWARLLDDGIYLCSQSTMYRVLSRRGRVARAQAAGHPPSQGQARTGRSPAGPDLLLGHHQAARPVARRLVRPVRDAGHLQPLRGRLAR
jgi:putative transposase